MSKLYVFAIGGTGSRVLRSLTMMMACGVKMDVNEIVPIIIDPDAANADLTRTVTLMNKYRSIRSHLNLGGGNQSEFFKVNLDRILPNFLLKIKDTDDKLFHQFIDYASMRSRANQAITKMLFSDNNLQSSMEVGFKGNPNIGSVVLNQIVDSEDFRTFANSFEQGDKIFIVSSIFGGTGASGFPLLLKTLRTGNNFDNFQLINTAKIGAITILPYFRLKQNEESEIDSSTFISKTKSALAYYENNIIKNKSIDALYYLGDNMSNVYDNNEGGASQRNDAHLIEFLGATGIVDFANNTPENVTNRELGLKDTNDVISFNSFYDEMRRELYGPMVQFTLFTNAMLDNGTYFTSQKFGANKYFSDLYNSQFYSQLISLMKDYRSWLDEMKNNKRSLDLFNNKCGSSPFDLVTGVKPSKVFSHLSNYDLVADRLSASIKSCKAKGKENKFMEMFFLGTQKLVKEKLKK